MGLLPRAKSQRQVIPRKRAKHARSVTLNCTRDIDSYFITGGCCQFLQYSRERLLDLSIEAVPEQTIDRHACAQSAVATDPALKGGPRPASGLALRLYGRNHVHFVPRPAQHIRDHITVTAIVAGSAKHRDPPPCSHAHDPLRCIGPGTLHQLPLAGPAIHRGFLRLAHLGDGQHRLSHVRACPSDSDPLRSQARPRPLRASFPPSARRRTRPGRKPFRHVRACGNRHPGAA